MIHDTTTTLLFGALLGAALAVSLVFSPHKSTHDLCDYITFAAAGRGGHGALRSDPERDLLPDPLHRDLRLLGEAMAAPNTSSQGGVPLDEWRKDVPPGWKPGVESYPLKIYFAKLKLWYRCCEVPDEVIGPVIAGRLQGRAQRIALELKLVRPDGNYDIGDAALVRLSVDEVIDPADGVTVLQRHIPSGVQALCNALRDAFGDTDEAQTTLELFFEHRRPHSQDLQEFAAEWEIRYEDAQTKAGLDMNNVAKTYLWLKQSGLPQRHQDDLRLQVQGDLSRFADIRALAVRLSHRMDKTGSTGDVFYGDYENSLEHVDSWSGWSSWPPEETESYWTDDWWHEDSWQNPVDDYSAESTFYGEEEEWFEAEEYDWPEESPTESGHTEEKVSATASEAEIYVSSKGKGKGAGSFGSGCYVCGCKWHYAADCPVKGKGKAPGYGPSKGKGKKGKGKSKGKIKGKKGKGKGWSSKGSWSSADGPRSWMPRYYTNSAADGEYYDTNQLRHARHGLHLGDSPPKPPPATQTK